MEEMESRKKSYFCIKYLILSEEDYNYNLNDITMNQKIQVLGICFALMFGAKAFSQVNDSNTPLHLMTPQYQYGYGVSTVEGVKTVMDRVLNYISAVTPAQLVDVKTGREVTKYKDIDGNTQLKRGDFRLTSYEWGVTYSAVLAAYQATGDVAYRDYLYERLQFLADIVPYYNKVYREKGTVDELIRKVIDPHALDDAGAICEAMIKASLLDKDLKLGGLIDNYSSYIMEKEYRLDDGTFARLRPHRNTLWLDDMFMGIPTVAYMGKYTGKTLYYDEAVKQISLFAKRMFVGEKNLFRHGWVEAMEEHPAFHWGRANGWALLTLCEVLDALPKEYPGRVDILSLLRRHVKGLAACQGTDGFWHQLLDRNETYLESSCTAIYTYCIAHAINQGWIDALSYGPMVQLAWHAVESSVNERGEVEGVCVGTGMGFDPTFYAYRPVHEMAAHGYGPVIWAGAEMIKLLRNQHPKMNDSAVQFYPEEVKTDKPIFNYDATIRH